MAAHAGDPGPVRYCPACYASNRRAADRCAACGAPLQRDEPYDAKLIWALGHPDTETACRAAAILGSRRVVAAVPALVRMLEAGTDPYRQVAAAEALLELGFAPGVAEAVARAAHHPSALVRRAVLDRADD